MDTVVLIRIIAGLLFVLILVAGILVPYWMIFKKAGFSPWLALLMWLPFVNLVLLYVLAFSDWRMVPAPGLDVMTASTSTDAVQPRRTSTWIWILAGLAAGLSVLLILMLMAMKTIGSMQIRANEVSAINSIRVITQAEIEYESTYPVNGYACDLKALGGVPGSGLPTPTSSQLLDNDLATSGFKSGYLFKISNCEKVTVNGTDRITGYQLTATPAAVGKSGSRGFCTDQFGGNPKYDPTGGTNCTQSLQ